MEALLRGWDQEIQAANAALEQAAKKRLILESQGAAQAAWIAQLVQGLCSQAAGSTHEISASIPGFVGIEGLVGAGTSVDELNAIIAHVDTEDDDAFDAQKSALIAIAGGSVPKPNDIAEIFGALSKDLSSRGRRSDEEAIDALSKWEHAFRDQHAQLLRLVKPAQGDPQLQIYLGAQQLAIVHQSVRLLEAHNPERTLRLVAHPKSLLDDPTKIVAPPSVESSTAPKMGRDNFNEMLDQLPWVA